jgi:hypothetical protein
MPLETAENTEIESILPINPKTENNNDQLTNERSASTINPDHYQLTEPIKSPNIITSLFENGVHELYGKTLGRLNTDKIAAEYIASEPEDMIAKDKLIQLLTARKHLSRLYKTKDEDIFNYSMWNSLAYAKNLDLAGLEKSGIMGPQNDRYTLIPEINKPNAEQNPTPLQKEITNDIKRMDKLMSDQEWKRQHILNLNPYRAKSEEAKTVRSTWRTIKYSILDNISNPDFIGLAPHLLARVKKDLQHANLFPEAEDFDPRLRHEKAKSITPEMVNYDTTIKLANPTMEPLVNEADIKDILSKTIPAYFLLSIDKVDMTEIDPKVLEDFDKGVIKSIFYGLSRHLLDKYSRPNVHILFLNTKNSIPENIANDDIHKQEVVVNYAMTSIVIHEAAHTIIYQLTLPELFEWRDIFADEIMNNPAAKRIVERQKEKENIGLIEMFAEIYENYILNPEYTEGVYPKSAEYFKKLITNYSSATQCQDILNFHKPYSPLLESYKKQAEANNIEYSHRRLTNDTLDRANYYEP